MTLICNYNNRYIPVYFFYYFKYNNTDCPFLVVAISLSAYTEASIT